MNLELKSEWLRLQETHPRKRPEPQATVTVRLPFDVYAVLDERANQLGVPKRK
jgi:hypothetical protein